MTDEQYRRRLEHEALHDRGLVWVDGDGDEWVQVEGDRRGARFTAYGTCGTGNLAVGGSGARWTAAEIAQDFGGLRRSSHPFVFQIAELP